MQRLAGVQKRASSILGLSVVRFGMKFIKLPCGQGETELLRRVAPAPDSHNRPACDTRTATLPREMLVRNGKEVLTE